MGDPTYQTREIELPADHNTQEQITSFLEGADGFHYRQTIEWACADNEGHYRLFVTERGTNIVAVSFATIRTSRFPWLAHVEISRGPIFRRPDDLDRHLDDVATLLGRRYATLRISPFRHTDRFDPLADERWTKCQSQRLYSDTLIIQIQPTQEEQWRTLRRSTRTAINKSKSLNIDTVVAESVDDYREFAHQYRSFAGERGISVLEETTAAGICTVFGQNRPPHSLLLSAIANEQVLGAILLMRNKNALIYEWGWTDDRTRRNNVPVMHRLIWEAINIGRQQSCTEIDLGGYWADQGNDDSINHFKLGFSKLTRSYVHEYQQVLSPMRDIVARLVRFVRS